MSRTNNIHRDDIRRAARDSSRTTNESNEFTDSIEYIMGNSIVILVIGSLYFISREGCVGVEGE